MNAQANLNVERIGRTVAIRPPLNEQKHIASFLNAKMDYYHRIEDAIQAAISTLQEYRTALISAAVTGKIDVRAEVSEPEELTSAD